jgi:hypothetical protein
MNAPRSIHADFAVLSFERSEGERFAIFRQSDWLRSASPSQWGTPSTLFTAVELIEQFVHSLELLTEDSLRDRLGEMGIAAGAISDHIVRARKVRHMHEGASWERVTAVGYCNEEGQVVLARTFRTGGEPEQRVFVLRCRVCGHQYGSYGADIPRRCCPNCQDGPAGLPL